MGLRAFHNHTYGHNKHVLGGRAWDPRFNSLVQQGSFLPEPTFSAHSVMVFVQATYAIACTSITDGKGLNGWRSEGEDNSNTTKTISGS